MKKILFFTACILAVTQSSIFAMQDENFNSDTLVIGGRKSDHHPYNRLTLNISAGHIEGSGWDDTFLESSFTTNKYKHILFEHVGYSLDYCGYDEYGDADKLAKIYFDLLKSGGTFDFLTWGDIFKGNLFFVGNNTSALTVKPFSPEVRILLKDGASLLQREELCLKYNEDYGPFQRNHVPWEQLMLQPNCEEETLHPFMQTALYEINKDYNVTTTVRALAEVGFKDIRVQFERDGVLGFTKTHHSLHISAKKPE